MKTSVEGTTKTNGAELGRCRLCGRGMTFKGAWCHSCEAIEHQREDAITDFLELGLIEVGL